MSEPAFERIYAITNFYDVPREGIADYRGAPHLFDCEFSEDLDDYSDRYWLAPISQALADLAAEQSEIFHRWRAAFDRGDVPNQSWPLAADRPRHAELEAQLEGKLTLDRAQAFVKTALFRMKGYPILLDIPEVAWSDAD